MSQVINGSNQITEELQVAPDECRLCGVEIWAHPDLETFVDERILVDHTSRCSYFYCGDTDTGHQAAI